MKLFKKKDKNIEAEETLAKNAESEKTAAEWQKCRCSTGNKRRMPLRQSFVPSVARLCSNQL